MSTTPEELSEIAQLADGTLDPARRDEVRRRIDASPELTAAYEREQRVVALLQRARATERAPAALRARIEAQRPSAAARRRRRIGYATALSGALAAVLLAIVLVLPGGTPGAPSLSQAAALATRGIAAPAPAPDPDNPGAQLNRNVENVYFPNWASAFGWKAVGQRFDRIGGRPAMTVYYEWRGELIAYTIVGAPALKQPAAQVSTRDGVQLRTLTINGRLVVTWRRANHTCILSGTAVPPQYLQALAAWKAPSAAD